MKSDSKYAIYAFLGIIAFSQCFSGLAQVNSDSYVTYRIYDPATMSLEFGVNVAAMERAAPARPLRAI